jgi:mevalonate kinase
MVQAVRDRLKKFPSVIDAMFTAIDAIAQEASHILQRPALDENGSAVLENGGRSATLTPSFVSEADHHNLQQLCQMNNNLLISLGVGHAKVDQICTLLGRYGIHPKMTGAGGGGSVFAFLKPDISQTVLSMIRDELTKEGYEMWQPALGGPGVVCHIRKPDLFANSTAPSSRSNTPSGSHQSTPAIRHKK